MTPWLDSRKWRSDSLEARIHAAAEAQALAGGHPEQESADLALDAVFRVMSWLYSQSYDRVIERLADEYDIETSRGALGRFWDRFAGAWLAERMRRSAAQARALAGQLDRQQITESSLDQIAQATFELMTQPGADPDRVAAYFRLILQARKQDLDERKIVVLEEKQAQTKTVLARAAEEARSPGGLTAATLAQIEEQASLL